MKRFFPWDSYIPKQKVGYIQFRTGHKAFLPNVFVGSTLKMSWKCPEYPVRFYNKNLELYCKIQLLVLLPFVWDFSSSIKAVLTWQS